MKEKHSNKIKITRSRGTSIEQDLIMANEINKYQIDLNFVKFNRKFMKLKALNQYIFQNPSKTDQIIRNYVIAKLKRLIVFQQTLPSDSYRYCHLLIELCFIYLLSSQIQQVTDVINQLIYEQNVIVGSQQNQSVFESQKLLSDEPSKTILQNNIPKKQLTENQLFNKQYIINKNNPYYIPIDVLNTKISNLQSLNLIKQGKYEEARKLLVSVFQTQQYYIPYDFHFAQQLLSIVINRTPQIQIQQDYLSAVSKIQIIILISFQTKKNLHLGKEAIKCLFKELVMRPNDEIAVIAEDNNQIRQLFPFLKYPDCKKMAQAIVNLIDYISPQISSNVILETLLKQGLEQFTNDLKSNILRLKLHSQQNCQQRRILLMITDRNLVLDFEKQVHYNKIFQFFRINLIKYIIDSELEIRDEDSDNGSDQILMDEKYSLNQTWKITLNSKEKVLQQLYQVMGFDGNFNQPSLVEKL